ncbi:MAG: phosphatidylinositol-3,5-bisphosphate 5-phosphatase [Alyxoria varia]|nr:MAG: phosphatidylinositol-3,5-bisphosphate 5-phosphatase [Alyxoria varia]
MSSNMPGESSKPNNHGAQQENKTPVIQSQKPKPSPSMASPALDNRSESPEPPSISLAEAPPDQGDDYGIAQAALEREERGMNLMETATPGMESVAESAQFPEAAPDEESEAMEPRPFERLSDDPKAQRRKSTSYEKVNQTTAHKLYKLSLYETQTRFYVVGADIQDARFRILKVDRTASSQLSIVEDEIVYSKREINQLLSTIDDGNKAAGGMKHKLNAWGLLGFIRFTDSYYMLFVTKKQQVASVGGHYISQIEGTELIPIATNARYGFGGKNSQESRFHSILNNLDLHRAFYFSTSYDVTRTLQHNITKRRKAMEQGQTPTVLTDVNDMFVWNHHLLDPALKTLKNPYHWCIPIIHGFVDQSSVNVFGRSLYVTIIARRSRFFAGARFLKRGANDLGYVANDVETEQIVADMLVNSLNPIRTRKWKTPNYTSFVQHRGSIPLYWTQDNSGVSPKPAIDVNFIDPFYSTAALHFDNLFERYSAPIYVLNLVKTRERIPRESKLLKEYQNAINYLNQQVPKDKKIKYRAYDMSRAAKSRDQDVIGTLEGIAEDIIRTTGFFKNDSDPTDGSVQNGIVRSNCIDCLDRTNAAQFVIGKRALAYQLQALGVITEPLLNYDSDTSNLFAHMFNDHGDTLASQYGGSHLVNTTDSYRKLQNWQSHSRDMLESFKRYYHNSFLDNQRQEAYNLFLGNYIYAQGQPMLWELPSDYYLHHADPSKKAKEVSVSGKSGGKSRRHYIRWFTPAFLEKRSLPPLPDPSPKTTGGKADTQKSIMDTDWWQEFHRLPILTSFNRNFAYKMNSTERYLPKVRSTKFDMSPFSVRGPSADAAGASASDYGTDRAAVGASSSKNSSKDRKNTDRYEGISDPHSREILNPLNATSPPKQVDKRIYSLQKWLHPHESEPEDPAKPNSNPRSNQQGQGSRTAAHNGPRRSGQQQRTSSTDNITSAVAGVGGGGGKPSTTQTTLTQIHANSLNPSVSKAEQLAYEDYLRRPLEMFPEFAGSKFSPEAVVVEQKDFAATSAANSDGKSTNEAKEVTIKRASTWAPGSTAPLDKRMTTSTAETNTPSTRPIQLQQQQHQQNQPTTSTSTHHPSDSELFREYGAHIARGTLPPAASTGIGTVTGSGSDAAARGKDGLPEVVPSAVREYVAWVMQYEGSGAPSVGANSTAAGGGGAQSSATSATAGTSTNPAPTNPAINAVPPAVPSEKELKVKVDPFGPLDVRPSDLEKKRYQAYAKWTRGKSIFKLSKVDPEFKDGNAASAGVGVGGSGGLGSVGITGAGTGR